MVVISSGALGALAVEQLTEGGLTGDIAPGFPVGARERGIARRVKNLEVNRWV